ncbi:MAG: hypothetical protein H7338_10430 [Candidatus Sericytochromatia bacterium]|nr:hypothetical protein [Candidatus Sericytochromatia bacterium]
MEGLQLGQVHAARYTNADEARVAAKQAAGDQILVRDGTGIALQDVTFESPQAFQRFKDASQSGTYIATDLPTKTISFEVQDVIEVPPAMPGGIGQCRMGERTVTVTPFADQLAAFQAMPTGVPFAPKIAAIVGLLDIAKNDGWIAPKEQADIQALFDAMGAEMMALPFDQIQAEMGDGTTMGSISHDLMFHNNTKMVDITEGPVSRAELMAHAPQENDISLSLGGDICGGAAIVNALIADSGTRDTAAANAKAILDNAKAFGVRPTAEQKKAVANLGAGILSANDVQHLQILLYKTGRALDNTGPAGISSGSMAVLVTGLRERGAFKNSSPVFTQMHQTVGATGNQTDHWVVSTQGRTINSWPNDGVNTRATVTKAAAKPRTDTLWRATIAKSPTGVAMAYVQPGKPGAFAVDIPVAATPGSKVGLTAKAIKQYKHPTTLP